MTSPTYPNVYPSFRASSTPSAGFDSSTQPPKETDDPNMAVLVALIALIFVLTGIFLYLVVPTLLRFIRSRIPVNPRRIEARYVTIEGWLITKRVRAHDEICSCCLSRGCDEATELPQLKPSSSYDTAETEREPEEEDELSMMGRENECPICMSELKANEIASWSFAEQCRHVFHHECIKEWLLRHANCPFCREVYMPVDRETRLSKARHIQLTNERAMRACSTFVCEQGGLVTLSCNGENDVEARQLTCPNVKKGELVLLRNGLKKEDPASASNLPSVPIDFEIPTPSNVNDAPGVGSEPATVSEVDSQP